MSEASIRATLRLARGAFALDLDFAAPARGITGILGPSGSGKTTLLRCIAGLERDASGRVSVNGDSWQDEKTFVPPHARPVGFVFQDARLFPHLTVRGNLEYGARRAGGPGAVAFDDAVALLALAPLLARKPASLSAGEAQRVAIGRALLRNPRVVLMDEPLANLDAERKREILPFLERLHGRVSVPILYVSHSVDEVARLCDHLVLMHEGKVRGAGALNDVLARAELADTLGDEISTVLSGTIRAFDARDEVTEIETTAGRFLVPGTHGAAGERVRLRIQARDVSLALAPVERTTILNVLPAIVESLQPRAGGYADVTLRAGEARLLARISRRSAEALQLAPGLACHAQVKGVAVKGAGID